MQLKTADCALLAFAILCAAFLFGETTVQANCDHECRNRSYFVTVGQSSNTYTEYQFPDCQPCIYGACDTGQPPDGNPCAEDKTTAQKTRPLMPPDEDFCPLPPPPQTVEMFDTSPAGPFQPSANVYNCSKGSD